MYNDNSVPVVTNCILWANSSNEIWGTDPIVTYSNVQLGTGAPWFGTGCIDSDPTFVNAAGGDFHLQETSPCLDAGTNTAPSLSATDFEGDSRIINGTVDMGIDEVDEFTLTISIYPQGYGSVILDPPGGSYLPGTVVQLTAVGDGSITFDFWFGDLTGTANPQILTMDSPKQVSCYFDFTGNIIYVNDDANGFNNGGRWDNAFTDLQDALDLAVSGMEIWVATGTYKPREIPFGTGDRNKTFQMKNGVSIYGGFGGTEDPCNFNPDNRDFITNETILSGDLNGNDIPGDFGTNRDDNCHHVFRHFSGLDTTAVLDGFTITGGHADPDIYGGGMYNEHTSPTVRNCIFSSNYAYRGGGGMYNNVSSPIVSQCTFSNNYCYYDANAAGGGGMYNYDSSPMLFNSIFSNNNASTNGGGMMNSFKSRPTVVNCVFSNNNAVNNGGGISNSVSCHPTIINCTFSGNTANLGGGIYIHDSWITLTNCILWNDTPDEINGSYIRSVSVSYSDIQGMPYGSGCIVADPLFVNPASNDLHLQAGSPCIDAGNDLGIVIDAADLDGDGIPNEAVPVDLDGNSRFVDDPNVPDTGVYFISEFPIVDMGAYEYPGIEPIPGDINYDGVVDFKDLAILCGNWLAGAEPE
jgi:hypothetical protein